jgi:hypothetical protein
MSEDQNPVPFDGDSTWLSRDVYRPAPQARWLVRHGVRISDAYAEVLLACESAAELRFVLPICTLSDWTTDGAHGFTNGRASVRLQEVIGPYRADFVFRSPEFGRPLIIEVDGPSHYEPAARIADADRTEFLEVKGFQIRRVAADEAAAAGLALRRAFAGEQMARPAEVTARSRALVDQRRSWPRSNTLAYGVATVPRDDRGEILDRWLQTRGLAISQAMRNVLTACDDAAEVNFVLPFTALPSAHTDCDKTIWFGPYRLLLGEQDTIGRMDVILALEVEDSLNAVVFDVEPPPFASFDTWRAELNRRAWRDQGFGCVRVGAKQAAREGQWWADRMRSALRWIDDGSGPVLPTSLVA